MGTTLLTAPDAVAYLQMLLAGDEITAAQRQAASAFLQAMRRPTVRWASPRPGVYVIDGAVIEIDLAGLDAAFCAVGAPGRRVVRAADFAAPGAAHPEASVRGALARAAKVLRTVNPALADAVASIRVERGYVVYRPNGAIDIET